MTTTSRRSSKSLTDWARQMLLPMRRWLPHTPLVVVADASYARSQLFHLAQHCPHLSPSSPDTVLIPRLLLERFQQLISYAA